jgi:hypothetical protein
MNGSREFDCGIRVFATSREFARVCRCYQTPASWTPHQMLETATVLLDPAPQRLFDLVSGGSKFIYYLRDVADTPCVKGVFSAVLP